MDVLEESVLTGTALLALGINVTNASMATGARDPYTDGSHVMDKHNPYISGRRAAYDIHTDGVHSVDTRDPYAGDGHQ